MGLSKLKNALFFPLEEGEINCVIKNRDELRKKKYCFKYFVHLDNPRRSQMEYEQVLTERSLIKKYAYWRQIPQQLRKTTDKKLSRG